MSELRPFALLRDGDQWLRCSFDQVFLDRDAGVVELAWATATADSGGAAPALGAGLAFDNECRLYHSDPAAGRVERLHWAAQDPLLPRDQQPQPQDFLRAEPSDAVGDFVCAPTILSLAAPRGLAVDVNDRVFVAESGADRILVYDLWSERLVRRVVLPGAQPVDLAAQGVTVYAVLAAIGQVVKLTAQADPTPCELPVGCTAPSRIAASPGGTVAILEKAGMPNAHIWFLGAERGGDDFQEPLATDLEWESDEVLVVARQPGADFLRYEVGPHRRSELRPLRARGYDGLGIVAMPEAPASTGDPTRGPGLPIRRIGYWTAAGFFGAVLARLAYERVGRVTTFRLDSGQFQTVWGRFFLDACIPEGAEVRVHFIALDETEDEDLLIRVPPPNVLEATVIRPDLSPPMPPKALVPGLEDVVQPLHRRESGRELPWSQPPADDPFETYEAPIDAAAGRYLWVTLELRGNTRLTPKIKCVRAEHPSHDYLRRLPRTFSRVERVAAFLRRYLAMFEGFLGETEARAVDREALLNPRGAPDEVLPWLASFVGLVLDERWARAPRPGRRVEDARRALIEQAAWLFRFRGTVPGLKRFLDIYTGVDVVLIEHFRLRGLGSAMVGAGGAAFSNSVLGAGFRVGGAVGEPGEGPLEGSVADAFRTHAHRFTVIIPAALDSEQVDVVRHILDVHRPAHTIVDMCTVGAGMRVGLGLHAAISSVIGPTGGFATVQLDRSVLGRGTIVGRPENGTVSQASRFADGSEVA